MIEAQTAYPNTYTFIGTDARIRPITWETPTYGLDIDKVVVRHSAMWSPAASLKLVQVYPLGLTENRKAETAHIYKEAIIDMDFKSNICISDVVGSEFCISPDSGQKVFETLRSTLGRGDRVHISFENIKSLSAAFLDSAIGQLYNGEIRDEILDEMLVFDNISPGRQLTVDRAIKEAKKYYKDPEGYTAKLKKIFSDD